MSQILQVDVAGTPQNIAEQTEADLTKYGARTVDIDARTKLEAIRVLLAAGVSVSIGDVNLSAASLSALENVVVSGTVGLDAASLSALESVTVSGTVALDAATLSALETITVGGSVAVSNFPASVALDAGTLAALETINVGNLPATQPVSGSVSVSNLPVIQPVSGSVAVTNLPATQPVSGTVAVSNLPATQPVSGTVTVSNFPATQPVSNADLTTLKNNTPDLTGTWSYQAGTDGTENITGRVISISAHASSAGTLTINGGDSIPIPANASFSLQPLGNLVDPALVFTGTDSYFIEALA